MQITTRRNDIIEIMTKMTFMFIEAKKIARKVLINDDGHTIREWNHLEEVVLMNKKINKNEREVLIAHLSTFLGRSYEEIQKADIDFATVQSPNRLFQVIYWMGKLSLNEILEDKKYEITFSPILRDRIGHHISGESWADNIKKALFKKSLLDRPIHIISANMHSVMNSIYAEMFLPNEASTNHGTSLFELIGNSENKDLRKIIKKGAGKKGLTFIKDNTGANIDVQIIDTEKIDLENTPYTIKHSKKEKPVIIVMDYAFGEQAYETLDELLKPYELASGEKKHLNIESVSVMGKAGILEGIKGDIMIPTSHIFEGTADNYPFTNELKVEDLKNEGLDVYEGSMITVLGTSLQNRDILEFFYNSTWKVIGLEMEGAHYQKAIQSASKIRGNVKQDIKVRYAYYASDNPLETGSTLASGGLGASGVKPTYLITQKILEQIF